MCHFFLKDFTIRAHPALIWALLLGRLAVVDLDEPPPPPPPPELDEIPRFHMSANSPSCDAETLCACSTALTGAMRELLELPSAILLALPFAVPASNCAGSGGKTLEADRIHGQTAPGT